MNNDENCFKKAEGWCDGGKRKEREDKNKNCNIKKKKQHKNCKRFVIAEDEQIERRV